MEEAKMISDITRTTSVKDTDLFLIETDSGTRSVAYGNFGAGSVSSDLQEQITALLARVEALEKQNSLGFSE